MTPTPNRWPKRRPPLSVVRTMECSQVNPAKRRATSNRVLVVGSSELTERLREAIARPLTPSLPDLDGQSKRSDESMTFEIEGCESLDDATWELDRGIENDNPFSVLVLNKVSTDIVDALWDRDPALQIVSVLAPGATRRLGEIAFPDSAVLLRGPVDVRELTHAVCALARKSHLQRRTRDALLDLESVIAQNAEELQSAEHRIAKQAAEHHRVEMELSLSQKQESIGTLAAGLAHEINTPIQYIGDNVTFLRRAFELLVPMMDGFKELIEASHEGTISEDTRARMESILEGANVDFLRAQIPPATEQALEGIARVSKIIGAMKEFSHATPGTKSSVDLNRALESTITVARNEWKYIAEIETDLDGNVPLIPGYADELNQVFLDIIVNAAHAIEERVGTMADHKGKITIQTRLAGDHAEIRFIDNGPGIPEEVQPKIFDPFFTTKEVGKGSGQGLALAYGVVVNKHAGTIDVDSEAGKGTTFTLALPLVDLPGRAAEPEAEPEDPRS